MRILLPLLLCGCTEYEVECSCAPSAPFVDLPPIVEVDADRVEFGEVRIAAHPDAGGSEEILLFNVGDGDLEMYALGLEDEAFDARMEAVLVPPGHETRILLSFHPEQPGLYEDRLLVESNDPETPTLPIDLLGEGIAW